MAKPTCAKCSAVATIAGMCGKCWRNSRNETVGVSPGKPASGNPSPAATPQPVAVSEPVEAPACPEIRCEGPGCPEMVQQPVGAGRRRRFCSDACRKRSKRN